MKALKKVIAFVATSNPKRAKKFYELTLGLRLMHEDQYAIVFESAGTMVRVQIAPKVTPPQYTVLGWQVSDITNSVKSLQVKGVAFERYAWLEQNELGVWKTEGGKIAWFKDPDGNLLSLTEFV